MYPVSAGFLAALAGQSMQVAVRLTTVAGIELSALAGSVTMDARRGITRSCELTLAPTATHPTARELYAAVMAPSVEILIERGLVVDGVAEYVPLGVFSPDAGSVAITAAGTVAWAGSDRSHKIARARFIDPYRIASGTTLAAAGEALLVDRWRYVECDFSNVTETIGADVVYDAGATSDPWASARALFADHGYDLNFDGRGIARATLIKDPATASPVFSFGTGETSLLLGGEIRGTFDDMYNGVVASGEGSNVTTAVRAEEWDDDPASPTYYLGPVGRIPYFYSSPLLTTADACAKAARTTLARVKGRSEQLSWPAVVNPALEPYDVVSVDTGDAIGTYVMDRLTVPLLASAPMEAAARETRLT